MKESVLLAYTVFSKIVKCETILDNGERVGYEGHIIELLLYT